MRIKNEGVEKRCRCRKGVIRPFYFLHLLSIFSAFAATAAVPLTWQVDTTRVAPVTFDAYHGETLALEAVFKAASRPLDLTGKTAMLYWQTNGMESAYWSTNAVVGFQLPVASSSQPATGSQQQATNWVARATFDGAMDPGAATVRGFLAVGDQQPATGNQQLSSLNYRAAFTVRFRPSPGFSPATLPLPTRTLDFATTEVRNAPYWTKAESDARYSGGGGGVSTNAVSGIITNHVTSGYLCTVETANGRYLRKNITNVVNSSFCLAVELREPFDTGTYTNTIISMPDGWIDVARFNGFAESVGYVGFDNGEFHGAGIKAKKTGDVWRMVIYDEVREEQGESLASVEDIVRISYTKSAADARFAPTNVAATVASKIDATGALGVFNANADYALTNLADNATAATLASGTIANLETTDNALNVTLSLSANDRSADAMLRIVNTQDVSLGIGNQGVSLDGAWPSTIKAGTNLVMFCKTAFKNNTAVITVTSKEIK